MQVVKSFLSNVYFLIKQFDLLSNNTNHNFKSPFTHSVFSGGICGNQPPVVSLWTSPSILRIILPRNVLVRDNGMLRKGSGDACDLFHQIIANSYPFLL